MDHRDTLLSEAKTLGIEVDGRWSDKRLQEEIDKKQKQNPPNGKTAGSPVKNDNPPEVVSTPPHGNNTPQVAMVPKNMGPNPTTVPGDSFNEQPKPMKGGGTPVRLHYDYWFEEDKRTKAGSVVNVDVETAKRLISEGKAERADPLPGEAA